MYPESAPENWIELLEQTGLPCAISPLHEKDLNLDGSEKKAHHHLILCYAGPTSYSVVKALMDRLNQPIPLPLDNIRGAYRYFTHMDHPDKYQYDAKDIRWLNGFDIRDYVAMTETEKELILDAIQDFIRDNDITEYAALLNNLKDADLRDMLSVARRNTVLFTAYIASMRFIREKEGKEKKKKSEEGFGRED